MAEFLADKDVSFLLRRVDVHLDHDVRRYDTTAVQQGNDEFARACLVRFCRGGSQLEWCPAENTRIVNISPAPFQSYSAVPAP